MKGNLSVGTVGIGIFFVVAGVASVSYKHNRANKKK
jgi:hypothetical protein